jgi:uncharacterized protein YidB (DUF937 family)
MIYHLILCPDTVSTIEVYGLIIDQRCGILLKTVLDLAKSGGRDARETRRAALDKLGEYGCSSALGHIIQQLAKSGDRDARETRRRALELI